MRHHSTVELGVQPEPVRHRSADGLFCGPDRGTDVTYDYTIARTSSKLHRSRDSPCTYGNTDYIVTISGAFSRHAASCHPHFEIYSKITMQLFIARYLPPSQKCRRR